VISERDHNCDCSFFVELNDDRMARAPRIETNDDPSWRNVETWGENRRKL
jgi:hypothetical protein